jgi:hypothetical protein
MVKPISLSSSEIHGYIPNAYLLSFLILDNSKSIVNSSYLLTSFLKPFMAVNFKKKISLWQVNGFLKIPNLGYWILMGI